MLKIDAKFFASISIDATLPKQKSRYVNETCRVDSVFNYNDYIG